LSVRLFNQICEPLFQMASHSCRKLLCDNVLMIWIQLLNIWYFNCSKSVTVGIMFNMNLCTTFKPNIWTDSSNCTRFVQKTVLWCLDDFEFNYLVYIWFFNCSQYVMFWMFWHEFCVQLFNKIHEPPFQMASHSCGRMWCLDE
jgi:hypothetical protein